MRSGDLDVMLSRGNQAESAHGPSSLGPCGKFDFGSNEGEFENYAKAHS